MKCYVTGCELRVAILRKLIYELQVTFYESQLGSGLLELKSRVTDYDVIKPSKSNCDIIVNFSLLGYFRMEK